VEEITLKWFNGILVTGGAGFIGSNLVDKLSEINVSKIIIIDDLSSGSIDNIPSLDNISLVKTDISNYRYLLSSLVNEEIDIIFHLAAVTSLEESINDPLRTFNTNVVGTLNLLELMRKKDILGIIYSSSVAVYGEPEHLPIDEDHPLKPINFYGFTKLKGEELIREYSSLYGFKYVILRYFNVYGPKMKGGQYAGVIYKFVSNLLKNDKPVIYGDGLQTRDFIYVDDVVDANIKASSTLDNEVYNIGTGIETRIIDLLNIISGILDKNDVEQAYLPRRPGDIYRSQAEISKAGERLGWGPKITLEDGLNKYIKWYTKSLDPCD
jgi:UDP-glucose 4-epimerase